MVNFRIFVLDSGREIYLGKSSENNDELVNLAKRTDLLLHTALPGSPFCNVGEKPSKKEINEAAIYCAKFSQDWRDNKKDVKINSFLKADTTKDESMKEGSWSVNKISEMIKVKKVDILRLEGEMSKEVVS